MLFRELIWKSSTTCCSIEQSATGDTGWLIALMVWLLPAADTTRLHVIIIITYLVGPGEFAHIIAGSVDAFYLVNLGKLTWLACFGSFIIPTLIGNIIGGVSLVAVLNYAQVASETVGE